MKKKPNIVFIIADDHRHDAIHAFGDPCVQTPVLDKLAGNGVSFRNTHIMGGMSGAVCMPSRACVNSGVNPFRAGGQKDINPDLKLMPEWMQQHGYHTYLIGKWHNDLHSLNKSFSDGSTIFLGGMSDHDSVPIHDFDPEGLYLPENAQTGDKHSTELFSDAAIDFIHQHDHDAEPFFLYLSYTAPHDPRTAPEDFAARYHADDMPLPDNFYTYHPFDNGELDVRDETLAARPRSPQEIKEHIADYYAMISHLDHHIGRVRQALEESNQLDNTIIVYTADHGLAVGQHGLMGKQNMYDHSVRIPCLMTGANIPQGKSIDALTHQIDIFPTLCELARIPVPETVEGHSLVPLIEGERQQIRETVFATYRDLQRMVKTEQWKLIRYYFAPERGVGTNRLQLFHLTEDPMETNDLSGNPAYQEQLKELEAELSTWQRELNDPLMEEK